MIEYVAANNNIDDRILSRSAMLLSEGGVLALPLDTSWAMVCSLQSKAGIKKLRRLSENREEDHFVLLCSVIGQFGEFCDLDNTRFRLIKRLSPGPYVWILKTLLGTEKALGLKRREVGIRLPNHPLPPAVIDTLGCPLYAVTARRSMAGTPIPEPEEEDLFEGGWELEAIDGLDLILDTGEERQRLFSTILDLTGPEVRLIRAGAGPWPA
jgi:tRNA threonylcarbamoyl adenosine modification protein (Sua5/YciO/YrdC/YwlC family)